MSVTLGRIAELIGADVDTSRASQVITGVSSLEEAGETELGFLANPRYEHFLASTRAAAVIVDGDAPETDGTILLRVEDPYESFCRVLELINPRSPQDIAVGVSDRAAIDATAWIGGNVAVGPFAVIGAGARVGENTTVGPGCVVMKGATVGEDCILYPGVTVMDGCRIGDRVILHSGAVIGSDGFGFAPHEGRFHKIPQIGGVTIEDDVEIGANTCIDRAAFGTTIVERGTKIDNLVQIAHNVRIGPDTVIAAQTGISGSTSIGGHVRMGGQAGVAGHLHIGDTSSVGAQAGVTKDVEEGQMVSGYPARPHSQSLRMEAAMARLPDLVRTVREQEKRLHMLEKLLEENGDD